MEMSKFTESMLIIFFGVKGIVNKEFAQAGQTANSAYHFDVSLQLRCLNMRRLRPELLRQMNWLLHQDNASSHTSLFSREFLTKTR
jgi:hypothetical protein